MKSKPDSSNEGRLTRALPRVARVDICPQVTQHVYHVHVTPTHRQTQEAGTTMIGVYIDQASGHQVLDSVNIPQLDTCHHC